MYSNAAVPQPDPCHYQQEAYNESDRTKEPALIRVRHAGPESPGGVTLHDGEE